MEQPDLYRADPSYLSPVEPPKQGRLVLSVPFLLNPSDEGVRQLSPTLEEDRMPRQDLWSTASQRESLIEQGIVTAQEAQLYHTECVVTLVCIQSY